MQELFPAWFKAKLVFALVDSLSQHTQEQSMTGKDKPRRVIAPWYAAVTDRQTSLSVSAPRVLHAPFRISRHRVVGLVADGLT